jgi:hypothetical protein
MGIAASFSEPLLRLWVGPEVARWWPWQAAMFVATGATALLSPGTTALLVRPLAMNTLNRLSAASIGLQYAVALVALNWLAERAFIGGQVLATLAVFPLQLAFIKREQNLSARAMTALWRLIWLGLVWTAIGLAVVHRFPPATVMQAIVGAGLWAILFWTSVPLLAIRGRERREALEAAKRLLRLS